MTLNCPRLYLIEQFFAGQLSEDQALDLENHLDQCDICDETVRTLAGSDDTISRLVAAAIRDDHDTDTDGTIPNLLERLKRTERLESMAEQRQIAEDRAAEVQRLLQPSDHSEHIGRIGQYEIEELLGAGGTGVVYSALDTRLGRQVALKILRPSLGTAARERFMSEARAAAAIEHPNVITIFSVDAEGPLAYIAMQCLPGQTLELRLQSVTFIPEGELRDMARQIAAGLDAAHRKNIVHRDVKPANLWIDSEQGKVKILDFGLARIADAEMHLTSSGMFAGTPNYMSPEQVKGLELDGRSDLFSLGCVLYRAATGRLPFAGAGVMSTLQSILHDQPAWPHLVNPACSEEFSALIMALLEKSPTNRPQSAVQFAAALDSPIERWDFPASVPSAKPQVSMSRDGNISSGRKWRPRAAAWLAVGLFSLAGMVFGQDVYRIVTNQGELIIRTEDPNVVVEISSDHERVAIVDSSTHDRIQIAAGKYKLRAGNEDSQFLVTPDELTLKRGEKKIVTIKKVVPKTVNGTSNPILGDFATPVDWSKLPEAIEAAREVMESEQRYQQLKQQGVNGEELQGQLQSLRLNYLGKRLKLERDFGITWMELRRFLQSLDDQTLMAGSASDSDSQSEKVLQRTFDGRTFDQWLVLLETETDPKTIGRAIEGLGRLLGNDPIRRQRAIEAIRRFVRKHGRLYVGGDDVFSTVHDQLMGFFSHFEPPELVDFTLQELATGTPKSILACVWLNMSGSVYTEDSEKQDQYFAELKRQATRLASAYLKAVRDSEDDQEMLASLMQLGSSSNFWLYGENDEKIHPFSTDSRIPNAAELQNYSAQQLEVYRTSLEESDSSLEKAVAAIPLIYARSNLANIFDTLVNIIDDPDADSAARNISVHALIALVEQAEPGLASRALDRLVALINSPPPWLDLTTMFKADVTVSRSMSYGVVINGKIISIMPENGRERFAFGLLAAVLQSKLSVDDLSEASRAWIQAIADAPVEPLPKNPSAGLEGANSPSNQQKLKTMAMSILERRK